jgi:uncharacterized protein
VARVKIIKPVSFIFCLVAASCTGLFFYPSTKHMLTPDAIGLAFEDVSFAGLDGVKLHAWLLKPAQNPKGTILFLHGNAQNISTHIASVYWLPAEGFNVFLLDYRGYGASKGSASAQGVHSDVEAALGYIFSRSDLSAVPVTIFGQSLGGAIAIYAAAHSHYREKLKAVVSESAFASYRVIARDKMEAFWLTRYFKYPLSWLISDAYSPEKCVAEVSPIPLLLIHGTNDPVVPFSHSATLYSKAGEPKELWVVPLGGHIAAFRDEQFRGRFVEFLSGLDAK